mmetsp:Transcript_36542/g.76048  ORF Transcript_36542/g.76048 Transcript_36542/m.76048 type:complete len:443 (-) Transcript_36542:167-1495(-)
MMNVACASQRCALQRMVQRTAVAATKRKRPAARFVSTVSAADNNQESPADATTWMYGCVAAGMVAAVAATTTWNSPQQQPLAAISATGPLDEASTTRSPLLQASSATATTPTTSVVLDWKESPYEIQWWSLLGRGAYGSVHLAHHASTGQAVAVKRLDKTATEAEAWHREVNTLQQIAHAGGHGHILSLQDLYQDEHYYYLVFPVAQGGELYEDLWNNGAYTEAQAARVLDQLARALDFLHHDVGVVHADLKPENVLLQQETTTHATHRHTIQVQLIDFGCATSIAESPRSTAASSSPPTESGGTTAYWPPERLAANGGVATPASDLWSLGILLYILLTNSHPWDPQGVNTDAEMEEAIQQLSSSDKMDVTIPTHLSPSAQDLLRRLLAVDPEQRLTTTELLQHPWLQQKVSTPKTKTSPKKSTRPPHVKLDVVTTPAATLL